MVMCALVCLTLDLNAREKFVGDMVLHNSMASY